MTAAARARRIVAAAVLSGAALACRERSGWVAHLPIPRKEWLASEGETRPGTWLSPDDRIEWALPAGPGGTLRGGYESQQAGDPAGTVEVTLSPAGDASKPFWTGTFPLTADLWHWHDWSAKLPARSEPSRLTLAWRAAPGGAGWRSLFVTEPAVSAPGKGSRAIVLFLIDTLRADRVSAYGYQRPTTPRLDAYFRGWLRAENCVAQGNWTLPSHASLFTSASVARHGVGRYGRLLPEGLETLAEALAKKGYRTAAISGGGFVDASFGFDRGFDRFMVVGGPAEKGIDRALKILEEWRDEPVFLFVHTYQVHDYVADEAAARALFPDRSPGNPDWRGGVATLRPRMTDPDFVEWVGARYDAALRSVDTAFGRLLEGLTRLDRLDRTAILLTSDHGEGLCDRRHKGLCLEWGHGSPYLYEEEVRVPLEVRIPWRPDARGVLAENAGLVDVAPTLVEAAGAVRPATFEGRSLLSRRIARDRVLATEAPPLDAVALRSGDWKLIRRVGVAQKNVFDPSAYYYRFPEEECHDLARDPHERGVSPCGAALRESLDRYLATSFAGSVVLRVPPAEGRSGKPFLARATGRRAAPAVRTFGLEAEPDLSQRGATAEARFSAGGAPVWIAFEPTDGSEALELEISGLSPFAAAGWRPLRPGVHRWRDLRWDSSTPLPRGAAVFTTPPAPRGSTAATPLPGDLVARLLSLGYLQPGPTLAGRLDPVRFSGNGASVSPGELRVLLAP